MKHRALIRALSVGDEAEAPLPTEFLVFRAGLNPTANGYSVLFDEQAAAALMAEYEAHGVDIAIDLEHLSLPKPKGEIPEVRADAKDARGWCKLELRGGELWAVGVSWTADGAERLRSKKQRYTSPAFSIDHETNRPTSLHNIAIVAMPATDHIPALVAASRRIGKRDPRARIPGYVALARMRARV